MNLIDWAARKLGYIKSTPPKGRRSYSAAASSRLTNDWVTQHMSGMAEIRYTLKVMRDRSRELARNNAYAKRFLKMVVGNVVGAHGIRLQNKAVGVDGAQDKSTNGLIHDAFLEWGKKENCDVAGLLSWKAMQRVFIETIARDGECLARKVKGFKNEWGFALQFIEADHLDENYNAELPNGNTIKMGVEVNQWGRPVAYHIFVKHPYDYFSMQNPGIRYERVPAEEMIHGFIPERIGMVRGVPWMFAAMTHTNMLGGYEEAEVIAARLAACKMGFFETPTGDNYRGDDQEDDGSPITEAEPGVFEQLPQGTTFKDFKPEHPAGNFAPFVKTTLRTIASAWNVSYNSLANDLEGVNFSSIRAGLLDERDYWKLLQGWMIEILCQPVFQPWLEMSLLTQAVPLLQSKIDKFNIQKWHARGFDWVDPEKDANAQVLGIVNLIKTRTSVCAERGEDFEEILEQLAEEEALIEKYKIKFYYPGTKVNVTETGNVPKDGEPDANTDPGKDGNADSKNRDALPGGGVRQSDDRQRKPNNLAVV